MEFRRKIYTRGSSYETTIPMPLLFSADKKKKYVAVFTYDQITGKWFLKIEEENTGKQNAR
ncbi:hypothetical protein JW756_05620 [Candidatus Woesearchaeota archaeon]|nr:hypothetical protein [Candidatus Woesearchaeota archaeon]